MAPASLKRSYMEELKRCASPELGQAATEAAFKAKLKSAYRFVSYNGVTAQNVREFIDGPANFFEGKVVVIDEAHNFVSRVANNGILTSVYQAIMNADNCKIVMLSGTPLINSPHELAYLVNLVLGYQRVVEVKLAAPLANESAVLDAVATTPGVDRAEVSDDSHVLRVKLLPPGFVKDATAPPGFASYSGRPQTEHDIEAVVNSVSRVVSDHLRGTGNKIARASLAKRLALPIDRLAFYETFLQQDGQVYKMINEAVLERRIVGCVSFFSAYDPRLYPRVSSTHVVTVPMSARQFSEYSLKRDEERKKEEVAKRFSSAKKGSSAFLDDDAGMTQTYRAYTRSICNFVFPESVPRPYRGDIRKMLEDLEDSGSASEDAAAQSTARATDKAYNAELESAIRRVGAETTALRLDVGKGNNLEQHSPKFAHIVRHLADKQNTAVIYSCFKKVEGIGLLAAALRANGWLQLRVQYDKQAQKTKGASKPDIVFVLDRDASPAPPPAPLRAGPGPPVFMIYENEEEELSQTMLNVFNSATDGLPPATLRSLKAALADAGKAQDRLDNTHGHVVQALLLTPSGAEGLNLRNVREVHLMEPFWHLNRIDQVIGRAVRARSHLALPEAERKVDIYMYLTALTPAQIRDNTSIRMQDKGVSSDEFVHEIAKKKRRLIETILEIMRRAAVDCRLHAAKHGNRLCSVATSGALTDAHAPLYPLDLKEDILRSSNGMRHATRRTRGDLARVKIKGVIRYLDKATGEVYDGDEYARTGALKRVGKVNLKA